MSADMDSMDRIEDAKRRRRIRAANDLGYVYVVFDLDKMFGPTLHFFHAVFATYDAAVAYVTESGWDQKETEIRLCKLKDVTRYVEVGE